MFVDTHSHLNLEQYDNDLEEVLQNAKDAGVDTIVNVGIDLESSQRAITLAETYEMCYATVGCHPNEAHLFDNDESMSIIAKLATHPRVVAIGETGLDYYRDTSTPDQQKSLLRRHIKLANEIDKPLIIHCREAHSDCMDIISAELTTHRRGIAHCFSGTIEDAKRYMDMGFLISIAGPVTFPKAQDLRDVVKHIPLDKLTVETDCPFLAPQPRRGKRNEPAYVRFTAETIAEIHNITTETFASHATTNAKTLFNIS